MRPWRDGDEAALIKHADNAKVARYMAERFPHPYTMKDALDWIALNLASDAATNFAIEVEGEAAGGIGFECNTDIRRKSAEIGYWLGEAAWGRGIATAALRRVTDYAFSQFDLLRLSAWVMAPNAASMRVLEKAGYTKESLQRQAAFKHGQVFDLAVYVKLRPV